MKVIIMLHWLTILFLLPGCSQEEAPEIINISFDVSETSVTLNWITNNDAYTSVEISVSPESGPAVTPIHETLNNNSEKSIEINNLTGLTVYNYQISLLQESTVTDTKEGTFKTSYTVESLPSMTRDSLTLVGKISFLAAREEKVPGIIMLHGWMESTNAWEESDAMMELIQKGYACMTFMFRGHGGSSEFDLDKYFTEDGSDYSPEGMIYSMSDVEATLHSIMQYPAVDPAHIGLAGSSMGAGVTWFCSMFPEVQTSVGLSTILTTDADDYKEAFPELAPFQKRSMYFIAASEDVITNERGVHDHSQMAAQAYNETLPPSRLWIINDSDAHGFELLDEAGVVDSLVAWFVEQIPSPYLH